MHRRSIFIVSAVAAVCLAAGACGPRSYDDPLAVMQDGDRAPWMRLEAADQAESQLGGEEAHLALLERLTWERGHPQSLRLHALAALVELDPERARDHLRYALIQMNDWEIIRAALDQIVRRQWTELTPAIVRNYARTAWAYDDADRPERQALQKLHPDAGPRAIALDVFDGAFGAEVRERAAAWQLLGRLVGERERLIAMLDRARADSPLVADLQAAGRDLGIVPRSRQTITWVQTLRTEPYESFWRSATQAVSSLDAGQAAGLELRHLPVLVWMRARDDAALDAGRGELLRQLRSRLAGAEHHLKSTTHDGQAPDHPQRLRDWVERLSFGDLLVLGEVLRAMGDRGVRGAWFAQARADHHDRSTEYGGLLAWQADGTTRCCATTTASTSRPSSSSSTPTRAWLTITFTPSR
jgi:hypothetical protein